MDFEPHGKSIPFEGVDKIAKHELDTFAYEYAGKHATVTITVPEYTAVCPYSGLPDFGTITIEYVPNECCIELRSLKYYLLSYRNVGIFYEHTVNRILEDLVEVVHPHTMTVRCEFTPRGGIATKVEASWPR